MTNQNDTDRLSELRRMVRQTDQSAFVVESRVVRRVIREMHGFARLSGKVPHTSSQVVDRRSVRELTHPDELGLADFSELPETVLLLCQPEDAELEELPLQDLACVIWRRLFHANTDAELIRQVQQGKLGRSETERIISAIGQAEFDEAHEVLRTEQQLVEPESREEALREFTAVWTELSRFAPELRSVWFPSLSGAEAGERVDRLLRDLVDSRRLFEKTRPYAAPEPNLTPGAVLDERLLISQRQDWALSLGSRPSQRRFQRSIRRRRKAIQRGNTVAAGIAATVAAEAASDASQRQEAEEALQNDAERLEQRLKAALQYEDNLSVLWQQSLIELFRNSSHGFWNPDKRLLYDLQKVCLDHERTIYRVDLIKWIVSRGRRPLRRPLQAVREVMMARHLASAASKLIYARLSGEERSQLSGLLTRAAELAEQQMREHIGPRLRETLLDAGLQPGNIPEQVAFDKLVDESLDCVAERGHLSMGYLRDAISRNDLKLPDLTAVRDLIRGDKLLRSDDRLDLTMDGVYRRGEFYLRWLQSLSSMFFGTRTGRFATLFLIIPFGGAVILVRGAEHLVHMFTGKSRSRTASHSGSAAPESEPTTEQAEGTDLSGAVFTPDDEASPETVVAEGTEIPASDRAENGLSEGGTSDISPSRYRTTMLRLQTEENSTERAATSEPDSDGEVLNDPRSETAEPTPEPLSTASITEDQPATEAVGDSTSAAVTTAEQTAADPFQEVVNQQLPSLTLTVSIGFLLMMLIHVPVVRAAAVRGIRTFWNALRTVFYDLPMAAARLPAVQQIWRARWFIRLRRLVIQPALLAWLACRLAPWILRGAPANWWWTAGLGIVLSAAVNSRLGRDTEELAAEWLGNAWYNLRARIFLAVYEWIMDFFKRVLGYLERFIYAVDEWLRFHSSETVISIMAKAVLGVVWSLLVFLVRIYVNLLIEPQVNPIKHFPVVTVAHKITLPLSIYIHPRLVNLLDDFTGFWLANSIVGTTLFLAPGVFGFLVWELKENWRLYGTNRRRGITPSVVGSHGETVPRLITPGFHSGTLPKLRRRMRRLESQPASIARFSARRALVDQLHHVERDIRRLVERELLNLLSYCPVWGSTHPECSDVETGSNGIRITLKYDSGQSCGPLELLFQEQSGRTVASVSRRGWLQSLTPEQLHSFETALLGFYHRCGVDLVREQLERNWLGTHPYDIDRRGLVVWPQRRFDLPVTVDLERRYQLRPTPPTRAAEYGLQPISRASVVLADTNVDWREWAGLWEIPQQEQGDSGRPGHRLPLACMSSAAVTLLPARN